MLANGTMLMLDFRTGAPGNVSLNRMRALNAVNSILQESDPVNTSGVLSPLAVNMEMPTYMTSDSWGNPNGNVYFGLSNGRIYRLKF
ncbi:hypothetical protein D3C72_2113720 [compost metagenome]